MRHRIPARLALAFLLVVATGCNALGITDADGPEVTITVREIGANYIVGDDGFRYDITPSTRYDDGVSSFAEVSVGRRIEIEYEDTTSANVRMAIKISADDGKDG